jgi:hypothetical protein
MLNYQPATVYAASRIDLEVNGNTLTGSAGTTNPNSITLDASDGTVNIDNAGKRQLRLEGEALITTEIVGGRQKFDLKVIMLNVREGVVFSPPH